MLGDASSALEMEEMNDHSKLLNLIPQISSHPSPNSNHLRISSRMEWGRVVNSLGVFVPW
jgi:hypothetical protein